MSEMAVATVAYSLYEEAWKEADRYKWIQSEKQGRDLGDVALKEWFRKYWIDFCRYRRIEHVRGDRCWAEFGYDNFGQLYPLIRNCDLLTDRILDRIAAGMDNLEIICWALDWGMPMGRVLEILEQLDINRARLEPCFP
ncbi:MAG: hypothetical protein GXP27_12890 [Planctomycetes bacterium]|nr:hypothetical protein [Planctomycetota bacterium]